VTCSDQRTQKRRGKEQEEGEVVEAENVEKEEEQSGAENLLALRRFKILDGEWTSEDLGRSFWLTPEDMLQVKICRGAANRLGFALNLLLMHLLHCPFPENGQIPPRIVQFVAMQLNIHPPGLSRSDFCNQRSSVCLVPKKVIMKRLPSEHPIFLLVTTPHA
jgi:hypothetical protein